MHSKPNPPPTAETVVTLSHRSLSPSPLGLITTNIFLGFALSNMGYYEMPLESRNFVIAGFYRIFTLTKSPIFKQFARQHRMTDMQTVQSRDGQRARIHELLKLNVLSITAASTLMISLCCSQVAALRDL